MKDLLISIFGVYTPISYLDPEGNEIIVSGFSGVDWEYIAGVFLFGICLISLFKIIGVIIKR